MQLQNGWQSLQMVRFSIFLRMSRVSRRLLVPVFSLLTLLLAAAPGLAAKPAPSPEEMFAAPTPYLTPEESLQHFHLPEGYRLEAVVTDPEIREPVAAVFDGNGNMYVAEMRTYMQDIDGTDSRAPIGRISVHRSSKRDGVFDQHEVFIDGLILPRMMLPLDGSLLVAETDSNDIYEYRDTTGDWKADTRRLVYDAQTSAANLEHQTSGLIWAADNWIYTTYNPFRLRWTPEGMLEKEPTAPNGGQWGLTQDNYGKPWFVNAGGEIGPLNFQQPIVYGAFQIENELEPGFREVFPLAQVPDVEGGPRRFRPEDKTLNHFTATCGQVIYRGDRLPGELANDLFFAEPVGRLIRQTDVEVRDGITYLRNANPGSEFIRSTDPNFRPVNMMNGPDGSLYIVDMYRGIIQESRWVGEGTYLRETVQKYDLDKNYGRGRIWRLVHDDFTPGPQPRMLEESNEELLAHLSHPNGWWRDTAQRLLILRQTTALAPRLEEMAKTDENHLTRFHAIWTLEGLGELIPKLLRTTLADPHPEVRRASIRASETLFKAGNPQLASEVRAMLKDPAPNVVIQALLTANLLKWEDAGELIYETQLNNPSAGVREIARQLLLKRGEKPPVLAGEEWKLYDRGSTIYNQTCFACHGSNGHGSIVQIGGREERLAPTLADSETMLTHSDASIRVLLHGLTGPIDGETYPGAMVAMGEDDDEWIASVLTYVRNSFGNRASAVMPDDVVRVRKQTAGRSRPWTIPEIRQATPRQLGNTPEWKLTASHNPASLGNAIDGEIKTRYSSNLRRNPGMWIQVELPKAENLSLVELDAGSSLQDYSRDIQLELSSDGTNWHEPEILATQTAGLTAIAFVPETARFVRLTSRDESNRPWWSIHELRIYERGSLGGGEN